MEENRQTTLFIETVSSFTDKNEIPSWRDYKAVSRFKSVRRAIRRGHVNLFTGIIYPNRPFNNRKTTKGRRMNSLRKQVYEQYMHKKAI